MCENWDILISILEFVSGMIAAKISVKPSCKINISGSFHHISSLWK
jgi:hypothetical protein